MHPWHPRVVSADDTPLRGEWPVRLWHRLLVDSHVPFGGRVLVIGCRHPEVVQVLDECSFDVSGLDDQPATIETANRLFPRFEFTIGRLDEPLPEMTCAFDLVLVHEVEAYHRDLLDVSVRLVTANLLACLKPQGQLFAIRRLAGGADVDAGHHPQCWSKHLSCFPGMTEIAQLSDSWFSRSTWNWLWGNSPRGSHLIVRHEIPLELYSRDSWVRCARRGQLPGRGTCCEAAAMSVSTQAFRRAG